MSNWVEDSAVRDTAESFLISLAGVCDGAATRDSVGFSGADTAFGHSLANQALSGRTWSVRQADIALKLVRKYQKQLGGKKYIDAWLARPVFRNLPGKAIPTQSATTVAPSNDRKLDRADGTAVFTFKYSADVLADIKTIKGEHKGKKFWAAWQAESKQWHVPVNETSIVQIMQVATRWEFETHPRFAEYLKQVQEKTASSRMMLVMNDNLNVSVVGGMIQVAVDDAAILREFKQELGLT